MSGNRFDFLEFAASTPVDVERQGKPGADITADPDADPGRRVDEDGRPLAQVVDVDLRGYRAFLQADAADAHSMFSATAADTVYQLRLVEVFGGRGIKAGQFNFPAGIAVDSRGDLLVADSYNHRVQRITPDGGVWLIGGRGTGLTQLLSPQAVAVDARDSYYIVEQGNNRVQKFSVTGALELVIGREGELTGPTGIAVSQSGDIYVADNGNCRIKRFDRDGNFVMAMGAGVGPGVLTTPQAVTVDTSDNVYVIDTFGHRVVQFDPFGRYVTQFGARAAGRQDGKAYFVEPRAVATDTGGLIYVADTGGSMADGSQSRGRLQVVDAKSGASLVSVDRLGRSFGCLFRPSGIAVAPLATGIDGVVQDRGDLYVSDTMNHRILRFAWFKQ